MDDLFDLSEKMAPLLDLNDRTTMKESLNSLSQRLTMVGKVGVQRHSLLTNALAQWKDYQVSVMIFLTACRLCFSMIE